MTTDVMFESGEFWVWHDVCNNRYTIFKTGIDGTQSGPSRPCTPAGLAHAVRKCVVLDEAARGVCAERRNRIKVAVAAYAYEVVGDPVMSDEEFDNLCREIRPDVLTGDRVFDDFFRNVFAPFTGIWVHSHPDIPGISSAFHRVFSNRHDLFAPYNDQTPRPFRACTMCGKNTAVPISELDACHC